MRDKMWTANLNAAQRKSAKVQNSNSWADSQSDIFSKISEEKEASSDDVEEGAEGDVEGEEDSNI